MSPSNDVCRQNSLQSEAADSWQSESPIVGSQNHREFAVRIADSFHSESPVKYQACKSRRLSVGVGAHFFPGLIPILIKIIDFKIGKILRLGRFSC